MIRIRASWREEGAEDPIKSGDLCPFFSNVGQNLRLVLFARNKRPFRFVVVVVVVSLDERSPLSSSSNCELAARKSKRLIDTNESQKLKLELEKLSCCFNFSKNNARITITNCMLGSANLTVCLLRLRQYVFIALDRALPRASGCMKRLECNSEWQIHPLACDSQSFVYWLRVGARSRIARVFPLSRLLSFVASSRGSLLALDSLS